MASLVAKEHQGTLLALIEIEGDVTSLSYDEVLKVAELCHERVTKKPCGMLLTGTAVKLMKYIGRIESTPQNVDIVVAQDALQIHSGNYMVSHHSLNDVIVMMSVPESRGNLVIISKCLKKSETIAVVLNMHSSQETDAFISIVGEYRMKPSVEQRSSQSPVISKRFLNSTSTDINETASDGNSDISGSVPLPVNSSETKNLEPQPSKVSALSSPVGSHVPMASTEKPVVNQYVPPLARSNPLTLQATPLAVVHVPSTIISTTSIASTADSGVMQDKQSPSASSTSKLTLQKTPLSMVPIGNTVSPKIQREKTVNLVVSQRAPSPSINRLKTPDPRKFSKASKPLDRPPIPPPHPPIPLKPVLNFTPRQRSPMPHIPVSAQPIRHFSPRSPTAVPVVRKPLVQKKTMYTPSARTVPPLSASPFRKTFISNIKNSSDMKSQATCQLDASKLSSSEAHTKVASVPTSNRLSLLSPQPFNQVSTAISGTNRNPLMQHPTTRKTKAKSMVDLSVEPIPEPNTANSIQVLPRTFHNAQNDQGNQDDSFTETSPISTKNVSLMKKEIENDKCEPNSKPQAPLKTKTKGKTGALINKFKDKGSAINDKLIYLNTKILKNVGESHNEVVETEVSNEESANKLDRTSISVVHSTPSFNDQAPNLSSEQETERVEEADSSSDTTNDIYETIGNSGDSAYYEEVHVNPRRNSIAVSTTSETNDSSYVSDESSDIYDHLSSEDTHSTPSVPRQSLEHVINSFLTNEYEYLEKLERLKNVKKYLPPRMQLLLQGINILHDFHVNMYEKLYEAKDSCMNIANVLISFKDDLKKYKAHLMNSQKVNEQLKTLGALVETNPSLKDDFRVMWQRLHYYHMNLEKMLSLCQEEEKATLSEAIGILRSLNLEADRNFLMDSIKDAPYNVLLLGPLLIHHTFKVTWTGLIRGRNLHAFLFPDLIVLASPNGDQYDYQRDIHIQQVKFHTCNHDNKFMLEVDLGGSKGKQIYTFKASKSQVKGDWLKEITVLKCKLMEKEITERKERYGIETENYT